MKYNLKSLCLILVMSFFTVSAYTQTTILPPGPDDDIDTPPGPILIDGDHRDPIIIEEDDKGIGFGENESNVEGRSINESKIDATDWVISIAPNPFIDRIYINSTEDLKSVTIFDLHGRTLAQSQYLQKSDFNLQLDVQDLPSGIYFLGIKSDTDLEIIKIIK